jgi:hypothetical protein
MEWQLFGTIRETWLSPWDRFSLPHAVVQHRLMRSFFGKVLAPIQGSFGPLHQGDTSDTANAGFLGGSFVTNWFRDGLATFWHELSVKTSL